MGMMGMHGVNSHLEQAETGLDTLNNGVSAALGREGCIFAREVSFGFY
jgi:hypothetical protein